RDWSSDVCSSDLDRMLISTSASGNITPTMPNSATHSQTVTAFDQNSSPNTPSRPLAEATAYRGRVAWKRTTSTGTSSEAGRLMTANSDSSRPATPAETPAMSETIDGSQANDT